jgi:diacylglycerol kinase (ATP)
MSTPERTEPVSTDDASKLKSTGGHARIANATRYSMQGLMHAVRHEAAFRQELMFILPAVVIALFIPLTAIEKVVLIASMVFILIVELLNSAVEAVVDRVSLERHPLAGRAKDMGSAAVFITIWLAVLTWMLIVGPLLLSAIGLASLIK